MWQHSHCRHRSCNESWSIPPNFQKYSFLFLYSTLRSTAVAIHRLSITATVAAVGISSHGLHVGLSNIELDSYWLAHTYNSTAVSKLPYSSYCYCWYGEGRNDFGVGKSIARAIGRGGPWKSRLFGALKWQRAKQVPFGPKKAIKSECHIKNRSICNFMYMSFAAAVFCILYRMLWVLCDFQSPPLPMALPLPSLPLPPPSWQSDFTLSHQPPPLSPTGTKWIYYVLHPGRGGRGRGGRLSLPFSPSLVHCTEQFRNQQQFEKCVSYASDTHKM